jgi:hypothetical protein
VNVLGHSHVALSVGVDTPDYVLGAVLPDLASMARVRLDRSRLAGALADGVRCHVAADAAFHTAPEFVLGSSAIRDDLRARGVAPGPARAIGHVGWELLLDGTLLGSPARAAYALALDVAGGVRTAVREPDQQRWARLMTHRGRLPDLPYDDPRWVAERLVSILEPRPRLSVPVDQVPIVAEVLARRAEGIVAEAPAVLSATVERTAERLGDRL